MKCSHLIALAAAALLLPGCKVAEETTRLPGQMVSAVAPHSKSSVPDPAALQTELERYADEFAVQTVAAIENYERIASTPAARSQALAWKVSMGFAAVSIASGPNPTANLLDFLSLATVTRMVLEQDWTKSAQGDAFGPWLDASRSLEKEAWRLADEVFTPKQQQEVRDNIRKWWESHAGLHRTFFGRPQEFSSLIRQTGKKTEQPDSVFALVGLDPTAGLDPAVREVTRTRLFAERAMYTVQRMPFLLRWQIELLSSQLLQEPQLSAALTNITSLSEDFGRLSRAAESASQTAAQLPDRITAERKAVLEALDAQEGKLRALSAQITRTLDAGDKMSTSLNTTIASFDALMKRFGVGEPDTNAVLETNSAPFNILDYAQTAERITVMAQQLDALIKEAGGTLDSPAINQRLQEVNRLTDRAKADAKSILNHAFLLTAGLLLLTFACAIIYRRSTRPSGP